MEKCVAKGCRRDASMIVTWLQTDVFVLLCPEHFNAFLSSEGFDAAPVTDDVDMRSQKQREFDELVDEFEKLARGDGAASDKAIREEAGRIAGRLTSLHIASEGSIDASRFLGLHGFLFK